MSNTTLSRSEDTQFSPPEKPPIVDEGFGAWITVVGACFMLFSTFGYLNSFGVYQDFYVRNFLSGISPSKISWIGSFQLAMPFTIGLVSGKLFDLGHFRALTATGSIIFCFSLFMLSLAQPHHYYQVFLSQGVGMGIGLGLVFVPTISILSRHFNRRRALASGIALSAGSTGAVVFPIILNHLIPRIGFSQAVRATAYIVLGCLVAANGLMRNNAAFRNDAPPPDIKSFFIDLPYMCAILGSLITLFGLYFPSFYLQLYAVQHGIGSTIAFYSLAIVNASGVIGRLGANFFADQLGPWSLQVPCAVITSATIWAMLGINDTPSLIVVSVLYGIFSGAGLSLSVAAWTSLARTPQEIGARTGLALAIASLGSLGSAPVQGALLTHHFTWIHPIAFSGTVVFAGSVVFFITRILLVRERGTQKV